LKASYSVCNELKETAMQSNLVNLTYEIELEPGEKLVLPETLVDSIGAGRWIVTVRPFTLPTSLQPIRSHDAFLNSYTPEDEGLYDDYPSR
jgi:hypothetical protein